jgi:hypothetical protein
MRSVRLFLMALAVPAAMLFGVWTFGGCGDGDADSDSDADGEGCTSDDETDGEEAVFVMDHLEIGTEEDGFDLDGVDNPAECTDDFCRRGPDDGPGGVDNRLGPILGSIGDFAPDFDANQSIADAMLEGSLIVLFRMLDVDAWADDGCVGVFTYVGNDPNDPPGIVEDRAYQVDARSLSDPTDIDSPLISFEGGEIASGTYLGGPSEFQIAFPITEDAPPLNIVITKTMLRWEASADGATDGLIGGFVLVHDMLNAIRQIEQAADFIPMVPAIMENQADIDNIPGGTEIPGTSCTAENVATYNVEGEGCGSPRYTCSPSGLCVEPEEHYDGISLALTFSAIPAAIDGIYAE